MKSGGRLIYMGAGTSGRLGVLDASECPPTFGVDSGLVVGIIAGGDRALRYAVENAEDRAEFGATDLQNLNVSAKDTVVGISASGYAPYCVGGLDYAKSADALTIAMSCNRNAILSGHADIAIEMPTGSEILSGSTRLNAGTATKLALNMLSTLTMVQMGKVYGNLMVDMRPTNTKLQDRAIRIVQNALHISRDEAQTWYLAAEKNVKVAIVMYKTGAEISAARQALQDSDGFIRRAVAKLRG
uniref:SIS domain-containing protein n=1 Tax=uncultured bacterium fosmid pJB148G3 TaxID=1478052 RepID=A0A0H3UAW1_9BACT|nr:hypothetical protein [uncultured bacterium fosmid pJB148G3]